jgi:O-antigen/teichoic acid export membrane protein
MNQGVKAKVFSSLVWKLLERGGTQGIQFIVQIVLARLLLPKDYGIIALITIFITLANVFIQIGFSTALIQKKDANEIDFSSVFYISLFVSGLLYIVLFFTAPIIAAFYKTPLLVAVIRVLSIVLFFGVFNSIQNAVIAREMQFKKLFFSSLGAVIISGIVGLIMAYNGMGIWALVAQQITNQLSITVILWFTIKWRPKLLFSIERIKLLFPYASRLLVSALIDTFYNNLRSLFIGKIYSSSILGFYNRGQQFPLLIISNINGSIQSVMLPALSSQQDNVKRIKEMVRRSIVTSSFLIFPMMVGLAVVAKSLVSILLTEKWLPAVPFLQIYCFSYAIWPIHTANLQAINALGYSGIYLKLEIIKKIMGLIILSVTIYYGVYAIAIGEVICSLISTFINAYPNKKLLDYSFKEQCMDVMPSLTISLVMGIAIYIIGLVNLHIWATLIIQVILGVVFYIGMAKIFKLECYSYLLNIATDLIT